MSIWYRLLRREFQCEITYPTAMCRNTSGLELGLHDIIG